MIGKISYLLYIVDRNQESHNQRRKSWFWLKPKALPNKKNIHGIHIKEQEHESTNWVTIMGLDYARPGFVEHSARLGLGV